MPTQEQMWVSVRETMDVHSARVMEADERVKEQSLKVATLDGKVDILNTQLAGMQARIGELITQMNAIAYQRADLE